MTRRLIMMLSGALAFGVAILWQQQASAQTKVNVGYTASGSFLPVYVAKDKGLFEKRGLDVTLTRVALASTIAAALTANSFQIGTGTATTLLQAQDGGLDLVAVSGASRDRRNNPATSLLVRKGSEIRTAADFKGKKVGVPGLTSVMDITFRQWLKEKGVDPQAVTLIEAPFPQMNDMLRGGILDAVAVLDPFREKILADGNGIKLADYFSDLKDNMVSGFWISTRSWADANVAAVRAFREASEEAISLIKADPAGAKEIEAKYLGVRTTGFWTFDVSIGPEDIQPFVAYSKDLGLLRRDVDVTRLVAK
jgi:NitT/TauT family transport system substrate-binding protein